MRLGRCPISVFSSGRARRGLLLTNGNVTLPTWPKKPWDGRNYREEKWARAT